MPTNQPYNKTLCQSAYGTDQLIDKLYIQPLSPPDARTVLLPESDNCYTYTPAIHRLTDRADIYIIYQRPTDCANMPIILITVVLISLQPKHN